MVTRKTQPRTTNGRQTDRRVAIGLTSKEKRGRESRHLSDLVTVVDELAEASLPNAPRMRATPTALMSLADRGFSPDEIFHLVIPKRTLARRQAHKELLSVEETDKAIRLNRIATLATTVFGNSEKAGRWLRKPKQQLNSETPLAFLGSEAGARKVEAMLLRVEHGILG